MSDTDADYRLVNGPLMIGLVAMPALFVWLLFRQGYAPSLRRIVLIYAFGPTAISLIGLLLGALIGAVWRGELG